MVKSRRRFTRSERAGDRFIGAVSGNGHCQPAWLLVIKPRADKALNSGR